MFNSENSHRNVCLNSSALLLFLFSLLIFETEGKTRISPSSLSKTDQLYLSGDKARTLENRLRPFLESRIRRSVRSAGFPRINPDQLPQESDFLRLAREWNNLSSEFKALYKQASRIPDSFSVYNSPGGNFEIYFTTSGPDSVNPIDLYGFRSENWSKKTEQSNGIPDYIDEVAWALDSCWSAMVNRFGFQPPIALRDPAHPSDKYKVVVENQAPSYYGLTWVDDPGDRKKGYPSYLTLRNDWSGSEWRSMGYDKHPEDGIRVTCAHELFHAVQYAMTWNVQNGIYLDDYPLTWIEGSAVMMEETIFDYIDDYLQYTDSYFLNPGMSFLNQIQNNVIYTNSLLILYLYKFAGNTPGIDFLRNVFENNYLKKTPFHENLRLTALSMGKQWVDLLGDFHTSSFFSGTRADTGRFLNDAILYLQWSYQETNSSAGNMQKTVNPYGMARFHFTSRNDHNDTLFITLRSVEQKYYSDLGRTWDANMIIRKSTGDSVVPLQLDSCGNGTISVPGWKSTDEIIVLVTNGHPSLKSDFAVSFQYCDVTYIAGSSQVIPADTNDKNNKASVLLYTKKDLRCPLDISKIEDQELIDSARTNSLKPLSSLFLVDYPAAWNSSSAADSVSITLTIFTGSSDLTSKASIYRWDADLSSWESTGQGIIDTTGNKNITKSIASPGVYAVFAPLDITGSKGIVAYPNPVHLKKRQDNVTFAGADIMEIKIYGSNGSLVYSTFSDNSWPLKNSRNESVIPGLYYAVIKYKDNVDYRTETARKKILVIP